MTAVAILLIVAIVTLICWIEPSPQQFVRDVKAEAHDLLPPTPARSMSLPASKGFRSAKVVPFDRPFGSSRAESEALLKRRLAAAVRAGGKGAA